MRENDSWFSTRRGADLQHRAKTMSFPRKRCYFRKKKKKHYAIAFSPHSPDGWAPPPELRRPVVLKCCVFSSGRFFFFFLFPIDESKISYPNHNVVYRLSKRDKFVEERGRDPIFRSKISTTWRTLTPRRTVRLFRCSFLSSERTDVFTGPRWTRIFKFVFVIICRKSLNSNDSRKFLPIF